MGTTFELARAALAAEILLIRRVIARQVNRAVCGAIAAVFAIGVLILLHCAAYIALRGLVTPLIDTVILLAFDVVVTAIFGIIAAKGGPDRLEAEARDLRDRSIAGMKQSVALETLTGPIGRVVWRQIRKRRKV